MQPAEFQGREIGRVKRIGLLQFEYSKNYYDSLLDVLVC